MSPSTHARSASWFTIIGTIAALVHYVSAIILESAMRFSPGSANLLAFLLAFPVSYFGHRMLSFAGNHSEHRHALPRFLLVACTGFATNQLLLLSLLAFSPTPFWLALALVMIVVALATYVLSRYWVFRHRG
ncbi:GtrA family protein [Methylobacillus arboreus]|uniref:GtrA family protein n=1 Tax=Methylobacillus arboreus TaxID=755170 RepID=UPI001E523808|nr:GtrA family protein [Methylobacillus arboreus]MCB5189848.1 GtrA family protein [Methylobacillus arboreus]